MFTVEKRLGVYWVLLNGVVFARFYSDVTAIEHADYLNNLPVE